MVDNLGLQKVLTVFLIHGLFLIVVVIQQVQPRHKVLLQGVLTIIVMKLVRMP